MTRSRSSIGFFGIFGRSSDLRRLDAALRAVDAHPALAPEGAKLAIVNLMKDRVGGEFPPEAAYGPVAELVGYCLLGAGAFAAANGEDRSLAVERRVEAALAAGDSADAQLVLLTLHAKLIQDSVIERFELRAEQ